MSGPTKTPDLLQIIVFRPAMLITEPVGGHSILTVESVMQQAKRALSQNLNMMEIMHKAPV